MDDFFSALENKCDTLRGLVPFVQFQKRGKHSWRIVTFSKDAGSMGVFHVFEIVQIVPYRAKHLKKLSLEIIHLVRTQMGSLLQPLTPTISKISSRKTGLSPQGSSELTSLDMPIHCQA